MKILFIGDIISQVGRSAIKQALPQLRKKYNPDVVIANVENLAHGRGVTIKTLQEIKNLNIDVLTGGNHSFAKDKIGLQVDPVIWRLLTPANDPRTPLGGGHILITKDKQKILVINLVGRVFMHDDVEKKLGCPFKEFDAIIDQYKKQKLAAIVVDFHAEATSEKVAFGFYVDGRASAVVGTHTHIPTSDERVLPEGTAYVSDIGMCGPIDSVLGVKKEIIINRFVNDGTMVFDFPDSGEVRVGAMLINVNSQGLAKSIKRVDMIVKV